MTKLHEVLAVEGDLEATSAKIIEEAVTTFNKRAEHFSETHKSVKMIDDRREGENTEDHKAMVTTVADKLKYVRRHVVRYLDTFAKKEATNQVAMADLRVAGEVLEKDLPATMLLGLESRLKLVRALYNSIPTLQPGTVWEKDAARGDGIYRAISPEVRFRTEKKVEHKILVEPTKEHPAQVEKWVSDVAVGKIIINQWSGMLSPAEKSDLLERIDTLLRAVKKARQRANAAEVVKKPIGDVLFDFIHRS